MPFIGLRKPPEQRLEPELSVGSHAPSNLPTQNQVSLISFLRHTGCPFAESLAKDMSAISKQYPNVNCILVCHGEQSITKRWLQKFSLDPRLNVIHDEYREHYGKWGVGYTDAAHLLHPGVGWSLIKLAAKGIRNRDATGTRWQQHASFLIDSDSKVLWHHKPKHAGDLPDLLGSIPAYIA